MADMALLFLGNLPTSLTAVDFGKKYGFDEKDSGVISLMKIKGSSYGFVLFDSEMKAQLSYKLISSLVNCNGDCPQLQVASHSEKCIVKPTDISLEDMLLCFWDLNDQMSTARIMLEDTFVDFDDYKFRIDEVVGKMLDSTFTVKILSYILPSFESVSTPNKSEDNDVRKQSLQESGNNAFSASRLATEPLGPALLYIVADFGKMFGLSGNGVMALMKPMGRRYGFVLFNSKLRAEIAIERLSELVKAYGGSPKMQIVTQLDKSIAEASEFLFEEAKMFLNVVDKGLLEGRKLLEYARQGVVDQVETVEEVLDQLVDMYFSQDNDLYGSDTMQVNFVSENRICLQLKPYIRCADLQMSRLFLMTLPGDKVVQECPRAKKNELESSSDWDDAA